MISRVLNEELGISNDVNLIVTRIKNLVSDDYARNEEDDSKRVRLKLSPRKNIPSFKNTIYVDFEQEKIKVVYYVVKEKTIGFLTYKNLYKSYYDTKDNYIRLYLSEKNGKINWIHYANTLQHEVEHFYQQYKKGKSLLNDKNLEKYDKNRKLRNSNNLYEKIIGFVYYYYNKIERNAIMNGLYRSIMENNEEDYIIEPEEILKNDTHYKNIQVIDKCLKDIESDEEKRQWWVESVENIGKNFNSFMRIMKVVVNEYTNSFARTIHKAKKDLEEKYKNRIY